MHWRSPIRIWLMMMMMMMMMMRRPSSLRVRAEPRHLPYIYIYIYSVYVVKWTSALVLGSAQMVVYQIDWQSTGQQHRGLTLSTTRLSGWTLPDHPHLIVDHEFICICPTAKYADISYSLQCGSRTDSAHESETWTNRKNKKWTCMLFKNRIPLLFRCLFQEQMP